LTSPDALKIIAIAPRIIKLFEQTQKEAESFGKGWNLYSALLAVYGYAMGATGRFEEGEALLRKALDFALEINDLLSASLVELEFSALHMIKGDAQETIEHAAKGTDYANRVQVLPFISTGLLIGGFGHFYQGDRETARAHLEKALVIQRDAAMSQHLSLIYVGLAMVQGDSGQPEEARLSIEQALALSQDNNERSNEILARLQFGKILGESDFGQCERAEEQILLGMEIASQLALRPMSAIGYGALGKLYAQTGEHKKALENLQKAQAMFQEMGMNYYWLARTEKALEKLKAVD
jgi:tetratricopeptide (TPR) repeat protein